MDAYQELIQSIRESRVRMSEECNHDPNAYIAHLKSFETKYAKQIEAFQKLRKPTSEVEESISTSE